MVRITTRVLSPIRNLIQSWQRDPSPEPMTEALARQYFPDQDPIGKSLWTGDPKSDDPADRIVGVVGDIRELALDRPPTPTIFSAATQAPDEVTSFLANLFPTNWLIRTSGDPASYGTLVRNLHK